MIIELSVENSALRMKSNVKVAQGTMNNLELSFSFDDSWESFTDKEVYFQYGDAMYKKVVLGSSNTCAVPNSVIAKPYFKVTIKGINGDQIFKTNVCKIPVDYSPQIVDEEIESIISSDGSLEVDETTVADIKVSQKTWNEIDEKVANSLEESKNYTDVNGGKIDHIQVNGIEQTIDENKMVNLFVPTKTSEITNDSDFTTNALLTDETTRAELAEQALSSRTTIIENDYLKSTDKTELSTAITTETTRATNAEKAINEKIPTNASATNKLATQADLPTKLSEFTDDLGSSPTHTHSQYLTEHQSLANYYTKSEVNTELGKKANSADVYTKSEVDNAIKEATSTHIDNTRVGVFENVDVPSGLAHNPYDIEDKCYGLISEIGGNAVKDMALINRTRVKGRVRKWYQMIVGGNFATRESWIGPSQTIESNFSISNNEATFYASASGDNYMQTNVTNKVGHKYLVSVDSWSSVANDHVALYFKGDISPANIQIKNANVWETLSTITTCADGPYNFARLQNSNQGVTHKYKNFVAIDLTDIFGSGNEPTDVNDVRVQELISYAKAHPEYDEGSLKSVTMSNIQLVKDTTLVPYQPYNGQTITFPQPVELNGLDTTQDEIYSYVDNGYLVTKKVERYGKVDLWTLNDWSYYESYHSWRSSYPIGKFKYSTTDQSQNKNIISEKYNVFTGTLALIGNNEIELGTSGALWVNNGSATEKPSGTLTYELATPIITEISRVPLTCDFEKVENVLTDNTSLAQETTELDKGVIKENESTKIVAVNADKTKEVVALTESQVQALHTKLSSLGYPTDILGYSANDVRNLIDMDKREVVIKVNKVDLGSLNWSYQSNPNRFSASFDKIKYSSTNTPIVAVCQNYEIYSFNSAIVQNVKSLSSWGNSSVSGNLVIIDSNYTDSAVFKSAMSNVYLYYELATPIHIDISDILTDNSSTPQVFEGGQILYNSSNGYGVYSDNSFLIKGSLNN